MNNSRLTLNVKEFKENDLEIINYGFFKLGYSKQPSIKKALEVIRKYFRFKLKLNGFENDNLVLYRFIEFNKLGSSTEVILGNQVEKSSAPKLKKSRKKKLRAVIKENQAQKSYVFSSPEWNTLRYKAFEKYGNKCSCCGRGPKDGVSMQVDHIKPISKFPHLGLVLDNLQILCDECNRGKSNKFQTSWK